MLQHSRIMRFQALARRPSIPLAAFANRIISSTLWIHVRYHQVTAASYAAFHKPNDHATPSLCSSAESENPNNQQQSQQQHHRKKQAEQQPSEKANATDNGAAGAGSSPTNDTNTFNEEAIAPSETALRRLFTSWQQGVVASIGAVMGIGFLLYFLYTPVKEDTVHHTAVVASEALADARLKGQAVQLSKDVVLDVLRDPKSLNAAVNVVVELLGREETKIAVSSLLQSLFEDHYTQEVTKKFVLQVVQDPWIQDQLQRITEEQVRKLLRNPEVRASLSDFLLKSAVESLEKPQFHYEVARAVRQSVASVFNGWF